MTKRSLDQFTSSLNHSIVSYDTLTQCLNQACALAHVALLEDFASCDHGIVYDYLSVLEDSITKARDMFEDLWKRLEHR